MRTTVIPAQITTIEDKIAGNLNLTQIVILMIPVFWTTIVYTLFTPQMRLAWYKIPLVLVVCFVCLALALRVKGKVVVSWLGVLFKYNLRPKYYIFNKNTSFLRDLNQEVIEKGKVEHSEKNIIKKKAKPIPTLNIEDFVRYENLAGNPKYSLSYRQGKKGGVNVAFSKIQK